MKIKHVHVLNLYLSIYNNFALRFVGGFGVSSNAISKAVFVPLGKASSTSKYATFPEGRFDFIYLDVPPELSDWVARIYIYTSKMVGVDDIMPAGLGQMIVMPMGRAFKILPSGDIDENPEAILLGPVSHATYYRLEGPFVSFGVVLSPLAMRALMKDRVSDAVDEMLDLNDVIGPDASLYRQEIIAAYNSIMEENALQRMGAAAFNPLLDLIAKFFQDKFSSTSRTQLEQLRIVGQWIKESIAPEVEVLRTRLNISDRQVQRLIKEYFGFSPKYLARQCRALCVAAQLARPDLTEQERAELTDYFYDQSHMIRELRHFTGHTPTVLGDGDEATVMREWLR